MDHKEALAPLHTALGHGHLTRTWVKLEIIRGLGAVGGGLLLGTWAL